MDTEVKHLQREILKTARYLSKAVIKSNSAFLNGRDPTAAALDLHKKLVSELVLQTHEVMTRELLDLEQQRLFAARDRVIADAEEQIGPEMGALLRPTIETDTEERRARGAG